MINFLDSSIGPLNYLFPITKYGYNPKREWRDEGRPAKKGTIRVEAMFSNGRNIVLNMWLINFKNDSRNRIF